MSQTSQVLVCAGNPFPPGRLLELILKSEKKKKKARRDSRSASSLQVLNSHKAMRLCAPSQALLSLSWGQEITEGHVT